jgi:hypothetical protein
LGVVNCTNASAKCLNYRLSAKGGQHFLNATLHLSRQIWRDKAQHRHGASRINIGLNLLNDSLRRAVGQPHISPFLGNCAGPVILSQKCLRFLVGLFPVIINVHVEVQAGLHIRRVTAQLNCILTNLVKSFSESFSESAVSLPSISVSHNPL